MEQESDILLGTAETDTVPEQTSAPEVTSAAPATEVAPLEQTAKSDPPATSATPDTPKSAESLTTPPTQATPEAPVIDWQKRYSDFQSRHDQTVNQWKKQYEQQNAAMSDLQKWRQERERLDTAAALKPWSKAHPDNSKFSSLLERAKVVDQQLRSIPQSLPAEHQEQMRNAIVGVLSPEDQRQIADYRESLQSFQKDFFTDPQGSLMPMVERIAEQKFQQIMERQAAQAEVSHDFEDPALAPLINKHRDDFAKALEDKVPYEYAKHMLRMYDENQRLRAQTKGADVKVTAADERARLAKGEASHTRDPRPAPRNPYDLAKAEAVKSGIPTDSPQFARILAKYSN